MGGDLSMYGSLSSDYAAIYRTQPNVRTVVDFLARNISQLKLKFYRRTSDTDREQLSQHELAQLLWQPNQFSTRYRFLQALVSDLAIYDGAYWLKAPADDARMALLRVPPSFVEVVGVRWFKADSYRMFGRDELSFKPEEVVDFHGYNPTDSRWGTSPLETLRLILAEETAAGEYREGFWKNHSRLDGVLERPIEAPAWSPEARSSFREQWQALYSGKEASGKTAILEEGMKFHAITMSAKDAQYLETRKLTREEVAAAYHIPPPMVGVLDHATFSNIEQQHRMLYQDTLGPWLTMIEEEIMLQLLPEFPDNADVYCEFNIKEKLKGSFEEEARAGQAAVGAPWMTRNEYRARQNLPSVPGGDALVTPLNVLVGGQASPLDAAPKSIRSKAPRNRGALLRREQHAAKHREVLGKFFEKQAQATLSRLGAKASKAVEDIFDIERWNGQLNVLMVSLGFETAKDFAQALAERLGSDFDPSMIEAYINENGRIAAESVNDTTKDDLARALEDDDPKEAVKNVFSVLTTTRLAEIALSRATATGNFGRKEAAVQAGVGTKTWTVTNPQSRHPQMDGETVGMDETFSNGLMWPGDASGSSDETAGCQCLVDFGTEPKSIERHEVKTEKPDSVLELAKAIIRQPPPEVTVNVEGQPPRKLSILRDERGQMAGIEEVV